MKTYKKCAICNNPFPTYPSHVEWRKTCSNECKTKLMKTKVGWNKGKKWSLRQRKKLSLAHIGIQAGSKHPNWKGGKATIICAYCKKEFRDYKTNQDRRFCNKKCYSRWLQTHTPLLRDGSREGYPQDWTEDLRQSIRKRDNYKCQRCGAPQEEFTKAFSVHHKDENKDNLNPKNLISLCNSCHHKLHYETRRKSNMGQFMFLGKV